ncbi:MAG: maleylpyruvate isomerase N-terminal domain-containing protein, partial [Daejeonella sp.]
MTDLELEKLKYPIGNFKTPDNASENRQQNIDVISSFSEKLIAEVKDLSDEQLDTPYRPEGWTVRQVIHHLA